MGSMDILSNLQNGFDTSCSNLSVTGLPSGVDEHTLFEIFSRFGDIQSCRLVPTTRPEATKVGFVNLSSAAQARDAVSALNGVATDQGVLEVVAGPPAPGRQQTPCDNLYVRNLPSHWSEQDLRDMFSPFGSIQECRILHRGDDVRGAGALVRMNNIEAASRAIAALNGHSTRSALGNTLTSQPLLVRYADSPEEKARKAARKEQMASRLHRSLDLPSLSMREDLQQLTGGLRHSSLPAAFSTFTTPSAGLLELNNSTPLSSSLFADALPSEASFDALLSSLGPTHTHAAAESLATVSLGLNGFGSHSSGLLQPPPPPPPTSTTATCGSLYVKNLPPETDKLWLYERFAPHGAILSVKVLQEEHSGRCRGVGFVNFSELQGALNAIQNVNGVKVADKHLHVSLQTTRGRACTRRLPDGRAASAILSE